MKSRFFVLWTVWSLLGAALVYLASSSDERNTVLAIIAEVSSVSPLLGLLLTLGSPKSAQYFISWLRRGSMPLFYVVAGLTVFFVIPGLLTQSFNPYNTVIFAAIVVAVFGSLKQIKNNEFILGWTDVALWILLWIPFDLRWSTDMQAHLGYTWWSIAISLVAVIGWMGYRKAEIGFNLVPKFKDFAVAFMVLAAIMVVVVPPGLITGFLTFKFPTSFDIPKQAARFAGLFLTVALPEELFFRGILYRGLIKATSKKWVPMLVSSLAFGLMHWNNVSELPMQLTYISLAAIAGAGYAWAYKKSGNNLLAAIITHTLVDWVWKIFLAG